MVEAEAPAESVWRNPAYVRLWLSETLSRFGESFAQVGIPIVAVLLLSATALEVGLLNAAAGLAFLVIGLPVGAWIDRRAKRRIMMRASLVRAVALTTVPVLWWLDLLSIWQLFLVAAIVGGASVFYDVAYQSYVPAVVEATQLPAANAGVETSNQLAQVVGPALAGAILAVARAPVMLLVTGIGYLVSLVALSGITVPEVVVEPATHRPLRAEIAEGLRFVLHERLLRRITMMTGAANLFGTITATLYPIFVLRTLGLPAWEFAVVGAAGSIGGVVGAVATARAVRLLGEGRVLVAAILVSALSQLLIPLAAIARPGAAAILVALWFLEAFGVVIYNVSQVSFRQRICPPRLLGRMNASIRFIVWGLMPIGALIGGFLGSTLGVVPTMWIAGALMVGSVSIVVFSPLSRMRELPLTASHG